MYTRTLGGRLFLGRLFGAGRHSRSNFKLRPRPLPPFLQNSSLPSRGFCPPCDIARCGRGGGGEGEGGGEVVTVIILYRQQPRRQPRRGRGPLLVGRRWTTQVFLLIRGALRRPHFYVRAKHGILSVGHIKDFQQPCRSHRCRAGVL